MSTVITNPSPKARFQQGTNAVSKHRDLVASPEFEHAIHYALLHYLRQVNSSSCDNFNVAGANQFKLVGATEFVAVLRNLSETPTLADKVSVSDNLDHKA